MDTSQTSPVCYNYEVLVSTSWTSSALIILEHGFMPQTLLEWYPDRSPSTSQHHVHINSADYVPLHFVGSPLNPACEARCLYSCSESGIISRLASQCVEVYLPA